VTTLLPTTESKIGDCWNARTLVSGR